MQNNMTIHNIEFHDAWRRTETSNFGSLNKGRVRPK